MELQQRQLVLILGKLLLEECSCIRLFGEKYDEGV